FGTFNTIKTEIDSVVSATAEITIKATAALSGDKAQIDCEFSKVIENADYNVVLVQTEEKSKVAMD
ncbi:MAG: hypothetical protein LBB40_04685, partial [Holophagales bacterium]|nr:hypothetical protein [Holophagales bacterium]